MSDKMRPVPFEELLKQAVGEYREKGSFFYVPVTPVDLKIPKVRISGRQVEAPIGPAAGPHTQLAQNIVAAYAAGARYFELKTVQVLEGDSLGLIKPCIYVKDEAYNTEWSTELTVKEALKEYVKAWYLLKLLAEEFKLGDTDGFAFNMSVGYNLEGIRSEKIDSFIESMKNAAGTEIFEECKRITLEHIDWFESVTEKYVRSIDPHISNTVSLSTMHGCPTEEIEAITTYLLTEKNLNTYLKCNPTLLGAAQVRKILDETGYGYVTFDEEIFEHDISFEAAVELIKRLQLKAEANQLEFGVKLTNTFPVKIRNGELAGENMYMSGTALYPLTIGVAAKLGEALQGKLYISYSGGADTGNIAAICETGICPVTVSTFLLKAGGYKNLSRLNHSLTNCHMKTNRLIRTDKLLELAERAVRDKNYHKPVELRHKSRQQEYSYFCSKCRNCVDVCPNRANVRYEWENKKYTLHLDSLCNECGNCSCFCILGHEPYKEKFTVFALKSDFMESKNGGLYLEGENLELRINGKMYYESRDELINIPEETADFISYYKKVQKASFRSSKMKITRN
jgi:putative selenate reductase